MIECCLEEGTPTLTLKMSVKKRKQGDSRKHQLMEGYGKQTNKNIIKTLFYPVL